LAPYEHRCILPGYSGPWRVLPDPRFDDVADRLEDTPSGFGRLTTVRHAAVMAETPPRWLRPSVTLGTHAPAWPQ
jgi:hypothetical protein